MGLTSRLGAALRRFAHTHPCHTDGYPHDRIPCLYRTCLSVQVCPECRGVRTICPRCDTTVVARHIDAVAASHLSALEQSRSRRAQRSPLGWGHRRPQLLVTHRPHPIP